MVSKLSREEQWQQERRELLEAIDRDVAAYREILRKRKEKRRAEREAEQPCKPTPSLLRRIVSWVC